ncbi:GNAT family N-acetyltransferase [Cryptosporangium phraense]|uniref:GNAT family N-acetyltransferase n=1 Tax=Cryptosporangium phraense TaxID=2593070 RepID=A0A545AM33_9ACTN|nr:GNAT family N-acetyltransferase [Cryptosporangium phraense]TQS42373.1 GNAT family N-acetyltransferase [Cryptosporangium phraense]
MPVLLAPTVALHDSWLEARTEWSDDEYPHGSGLRPEYDVDSPAGFAAWIDSLHRRNDYDVPATYWWIVEDDVYLGAIALRHTLTPPLLQVGGHIGYNVRPSARNRGLATWALGAVLDEARAMGLSRVLITCKTSNLASARVIEHRSGVLEDTRITDEGLTYRYWVELKG